ncbi:unnamed protein product [Sphagnum jensenii]|uniref:Uncharacterized protein n=1 Tax=Sphagnum jensenii TaxID=128206 RepID=A0ABP0WL59_9BRYO
MANSAPFFPQCVFVALDCCRLDHAPCCTRSSFWFAGKSLSLCRFSNPRVSKRITTGQCQLRHMHKLVDFPSGRWDVVGARAPGGDSPDDGDGDSEEEEDGSRTDENFTSFSSSNDDVNSQQFREQMERMLDNEDATFAGKDLAVLIRKKYGRSYDVQLIKKDFMGRQLLAMNVMWKYREQRSFPLTEEEYLLRLDSVASTLKGWGAVSYVRSTLAKTKERPRIGKAVSIFIDINESGGRAKEWINR